jgi:hypothetical protein
MGVVYKAVQLKGGTDLANWKLHQAVVDRLFPAAPPKEKKRLELFGEPESAVVGRVGTP